ncbi:type II secretion system F family protein [Sphingomonas morindae]|uniref:Type II secretion system F family protein n=1 Tax=Sphingomonas morindae TaxID=1541170 RepID=A0ABY4X4X4_9SPHN|nr:type II secretion system F family protein [Sphingomonas morindae]USI71935.1 type II secretion system F family protein [Sphingomonas morindae]
MIFLLPLGASCAFLLVAMALMTPSTSKTRGRRMEAIRARHGESGDSAAQAQLRRVQTQRETRLDSVATRLLPNPERLQQRLAMTGRDWSLGQYLMVCGGLGLIAAMLPLLRGAPMILALLSAVTTGLGLPHKAVGFLIKRRVNAFTAKFPEAIELLVRGLRSGLPISETLAVVGAEIPGPVGVEFRLICDRIRIGRTMEAALQETAERIGTAEFQFFVITLAIQRETGGNLAETLSNLAEVLRKRAQMKLKIRAMASESKASAYIVGALPFIVFMLVWWMNGKYIQNFFHDPRLMIAGTVGLVWMGLGAFIMSKMVNFEI